jgi:hypothetical protein
METTSPSAGRIGAALRALRRTHRPDAGDPAALGVKCLQAVIAELAADGVSPEDLQPLADLEGTVAGKAPAEPKARRDRRHSAAPSGIVLARASATIDLLVKAGQDEAEAAQTVMRRLMAAGIPPPAQGGDSRGWRRLLEFRNTLAGGGGTADDKYEYRTFTREIEAIPPAERVNRVLEDRLWDRRQKPR